MVRRSKLAEGEISKGGEAIPRGLGAEESLGQAMQGIAVLR